MRHWFAHFLRAEHGSAVFDGLILLTGVALMSASILIAVMPGSGDVTDDGFDRAGRVEEIRPA